MQRVDVDSLRLVRPRSVGVELVGLWALEQLKLPALLADLAPRHRLHHPRAGDLVAKPLEVRHPLAEILAWGVDPAALGTGLVVHSPERNADRGDKPSPDADDRPGRGVHQLGGWHVTPAPPRRDTETDRMWSALSSILRSTAPSATPVAAPVAA